VRDTIPGYQEGGNFSKDHGTADLNGEVVATLCGVVGWVNKLVLVRFPYFSSKAAEHRGG
jgi:exosome complex component RRP4